MKLLKKIVLTSTLECLTGLHIGDSKDNVEIGGLDLPVIRCKAGNKSNQPYIPGSSLKGKMRSLLQQVFGEIGKDLFEAKETITNLSTSELFGCLDGKTKLGNASRLIVRDAYLQNSEELKNSPHTDMPYTELKTENSINRVNGVAENPRAIERVPAGAKFVVEFVINIFGQDEKDTKTKAKEDQFLALFNLGIALLENDYLGGSGSRGSGQIKFSPFQQTHIDISAKVAAYQELFS